MAFVPGQLQEPGPECSGHLDFPVLLGTLHPHLVFETLAYAVGFQFFLWLRRHRGEVLAEGQRPLLVLAAIVGAFVGAKVLAWLVDPVHIWEHRHDWRVWAEGKTIVGGLLGGTLAVEWAKRRMGITRATGDLYAIPLALGIAIGRIGCFLTGLDDRTHGIAVPAWMQAVGVDFGDGVARHPTQLYEILFLAGLVFVLLRRLKRGHAEGTQFKLFLGAYLGWRFLVGFIQPEPALGFSAIQWASLAGSVFATIALVRSRRHTPRAEADRRPPAEPTHD
jgi:phosphatidylglycerol---prolipoprotein diacylglyceryl transferase